MRSWWKAARPLFGGDQEIAAIRSGGRAGASNARLGGESGISAFGGDHGKQSFIRVTGQGAPRPGDGGDQFVR